MSLITPTSGLYNRVTDSPPPDLSGYILGNKATLIDGDKTTGCGSWNGWNVVYESYGLDLGSAQEVRSFKLYDSFGIGTVNNAQVIILYGSDNSNWTNLETLSWPTNIQRTGGSPGIWTIPLTTPTSARYWRIYIAGVFSVNFTSVEFSELEAYTSDIQEYLATITSDSYILSHSTANPYEFEYSQEEPSDYLPPTYREPQLKHDCDHVLDGIQYTLGTCPRCLGNGYYYDIKIDNDGRVMQISGVDKLTQELEKITLTPIGDNIFHDRYGTLLYRAHSEAPTRELREVQLKKSIIEAVMRLRTAQLNDIRQGKEFAATELIDRIEKIEVFDIYDSPTSIGYNVYIFTVAGVLATVRGEVGF